MATGPRVDHAVLEDHRRRLQASQLHDVAQRAFNVLYPQTSEVIASFEKLKYKMVAEGVTTANLWCAIAIAKIVGGSEEDLHKMIKAAWAVVVPATSPDGQAANATAKSRLITPGGAPLEAATRPPVHEVAEPGSEASQIGDEIDLADNAGTVKPAKAGAPE